MKIDVSASSPSFYFSWISNDDGVHMFLPCPVGNPLYFKKTTC